MRYHYKCGNCGTIWQDKHGSNNLFGDRCSCYCPNPECIPKPIPIQVYGTSEIGYPQICIEEAIQQGRVTIQ